MRLPETRDAVARELTFPVDRDAVIDALGENELEAPYGESESLADVLGRADADSFGSADELYDALVMYVSDAYIGRKFYDDRGINPEGTEEVSF